MTEEEINRALARVGQCDNAVELRKTIINAKRHDVPEVIRAAQMRLYELLPEHAPGSVEHDVWSCIHALEDALTEERGKTVRLSRTRQKIGRDGEYQTVIDLVAGKQSSGFDMMIEREMPKYTFEAVTLRHPSVFDEACRARATQRLAEVGVDASAVVGSRA